MRWEIFVIKGKAKKIDLEIFNKEFKRKKKDR
jgi:hypothetical protein